MSITEQISALKAKAAMKQSAVDSCPGHIWRADYVSQIRTGGSCVCIQCGERRAWENIDPRDQMKFTTARVLEPPF